MSSLIRCPKCKRPRRVEVDQAKAVDPCATWADPPPIMQCAGCGEFYAVVGGFR